MRLTRFICVLFTVGALAARAGEEKIWTGAQSGVWDTSVLNWQVGGQPAAFVAGDDPIFTDAATTKAVTLGSSQSAGKVVFDGSTDYSLTSPITVQNGTTTSAGLAVASLFEKRGTGVLTVNGMHSFTGDIAVIDGTYKVGSGTTDQWGAFISPLGNPRAPRKIFVYTNATLQLAATGVFGAGTSDSDVLADVEIRGGTLKLAAKSCTCFGNLLFHNATVEDNNGATNWPTFCLNGSWLEFASDDPAKPYVFANAGSTSGFFLSRTRPIDLRVPDITGNADADVTFNCLLKDITHGNWPCTTNFVKTGAGTLALGNTGNNFIRDVVVSNGTLKCAAGRARIGTDATVSVLGNANVPHTVYVEKGATLIFDKSDIQGQFYHDSKIAVHVRGGTLKQSAKCTNGLGPLVLDDATLEYDDVTASGWPTFGFSDVTFKGTSAYTLNQVNGSYFAFGMNGMANVKVTDIVSGGVFSGAPDVTIGSPINDSSNVWYGYGPRESTFRKTGAGVLSLSNTSSTFSGDVEVSEGVVTLAKKGTAENPSSGPLGNLMSGKKVTVCGSGEIYVGFSDNLSQLGANYDCTLVVSNGTFRFAAGTVNAWPRLELFDPNFIYTTGVGAGSREDSDYGWGLWGFRYPVTFDGTKPIEWSNKGAYNLISLGYSSDFSEEYPGGGITNLHGKTEFCVKDITKDPRADVVIGLDVQSLPHWTNTGSIFKNYRYRCGLLKTGAGTLRLTGKFSCPEDTRIAEGTLLFDGTLREQISGWGTSTMRVQDGAFLGGTGTVGTVVLESGGGFAVSAGQTTALTMASLEPAAGVTSIAIDIANPGDEVALQGLNVPVLSAPNAGALSYTVTMNGAPPPLNWRYMAYVQDGVLRARSVRMGMMISVR